jgi:hypothetical protein
MIVVVLANVTAASTHHLLTAVGNCLTACTPCQCTPSVQRPHYCILTAAVTLSLLLLLYTTAAAAVQSGSLSLAT